MASLWLSGCITLPSGVTAPYETPEKSDIVLSPREQDVEACVDQIIETLHQRGVIEKESSI